MSQTCTSQIENTEPGDLTSIEHLPLPYIEVDVDGNVSRINARAEQLLGLDRQEIIMHSAWGPVARDQIAESREAFFKMISSAADPAPVRRAILSKAGSYRTVDLFRTLVRGNDDAVTGVRHIAVDVTETVQACEQAQRSLVWLESVVESLASAVVVTDALGFIRYSNPAVEKLTGWLPSELEGKIIDKLLPVLSYSPDDGIPLVHNARFKQHCTGTAIILDRKRYQIRVKFETTPVIDKKAGGVSGLTYTFSKLPDRDNVP